MDLNNFLNQIENNQIIFAIIITIILVIIFEYIKFYISVHIHPIFYVFHKELLMDIVILLFIQAITASFVLFIICKLTIIFNCEFPLNIFYVAFFSSGFTVGLFDKIEIYSSEDDTKKLNIIRDYINKFRNEIIQNINMLNTANNRKIGAGLESNYSLEQLKVECRNLFKEKFSELEKDYGEEPSFYALAIIEKNPQYAKELLDLSH